MRPTLAGALLAGLLLAGSAGAQEPEPVPEQPLEDEEGPLERERRDRPSLLDRLGQAPGPDEAGEVTEIRIRAETFGGTPGHGWYRGFVDLTAGDTRIQADRMDLYETEKPDGGKGRKLVAEGNVVFIRAEERLSGARMTMDLDSGVGVFEEALGYVDPGVFVEGRRIERLDADTYRIEGARFTSCAQPSPRWDFSASSARLEVGDKIVARNVVFHVKRVPALYVPYLVYPVREDQRSTGFLFPSFGYSSTRGVNLGEAFFWAMGRSVDQTFAVDNYSKFGYGFGHEFRYASASPSRGTFRTYVFQPKGGGELDYDLDYQALQLLPGGTRATVSVRQYSNLLFQQNLQDSFNLATTRTRRASFNLQKSLGKTNVQLLADSTDTFFTNRTRVNRHLPLLRLNMAPQKLWGSGVTFRYDARAERLENGSKNDSNNPNANRIIDYSRFDVNPELSRPLSLSFLQLTPRVEGRYTYYGDSLGEDGRETGEPLRRAYMESSVELRGPTFARVYNTPGNFYSEKYKHVIGPEFVYLYRSGVEDFSSIPRFDAVDIVRDTNQVQYALVQSLLAKRSGAGGKEVPYEFLSWRVGQTYYVDEASSEFDPEYSSSGFEGEGSRLSALQSRVKFQPTPRLRANFDLEYDVKQSVLRTLTLSTNLSGARGSLQASWSRSESFVRNSRNIPARSSVRGGGRLELLPDRLAVELQGNYDFVTRTMLQSSARLRYDVQCCGFLAEVLRYDFNQRVEQQFRFSIELANIGSFGNFNGEERGQTKALGTGSFK